jgi:glycosyltransferase involved in cell wall biosynthesis
LNIKHSILFLLPRFSGGGAERVVLNLLTGLHNRGHSIGIVVFDLSGPLITMVPAKVPIYNLGTVSLKRSIIPLANKINQLKPKVVFSTFGYINVALLAVRWALPKKTKIWIREANLPSISLPNNRNPRVMTFLYRFLYRKTDKLICTSIRMRDEFVSDFLISSSVIDILPNPVDVETIVAFSKAVKRFDKGGVCYIASGRLTYQKGFDLLLYWFSQLEDKRSTLTILGDGVLKDELLRETESFNIQNRVKFIGHCDNPWKWYAGADVFLLSSRWEGMPNAALESLACGTPVIATSNSGGIAELGALVKEGSVIVTSTAEEFILEMEKVKSINTKYPKDSLLPAIYSMNHAVLILQSWLNL